MTLSNVSFKLSRPVQHKTSQYHRRELTLMCRILMWQNWLIHLSPFNQHSLCRLSIARRMVCYRLQSLLRKQRVKYQFKSTLLTVATMGSTSAPSPAPSRTRRGSGWSQVTSMQSTRTSRPFSIEWKDRDRLHKSLSSSKVAARPTRRQRTWLQGSTLYHSLSSYLRTSPVPTSWKFSAVTAKSTQCAFATP